MRVGNDEHLSIGRFAQLTGLTAKALRHYDELGLLRPAYVDDFTGYRWYSLEQARDAVAIRRLRSFELPLDEIAEVLLGDGALLRERLAVQRARLEGRAVVTERMIDELDRVLRGEEELVSARRVDYRVQDMPEFVLAAIHRPARLGELPIPELIGETGTWAFAHDRVPGAPVAICPADDDGMVELRVGWPVLGTVEPPAPIELLVCPAGRAVVHTYVGDFMALCDELAAFVGVAPGRRDPSAGRAARALRDEPRRSERSVRARHTSGVAAPATGGVRWSTRSRMSPSGRMR